MPSTKVDRERVLAACALLDAAGGPVPMDELAAAVHCSARQLSRSFSAVLGVSPRDYGEAVRTGRARALLQDADSVSDAVYAAGYGSSRAFYEETGQRLGMSPRDYASGAPGKTLFWSASPAHLMGMERLVLAVASSAGLCAVRIGEQLEPLLDECRGEFRGAVLERDDEALAPIMGALVDLAEGRASGSDIPLDVHGTAFQARVWDALVQIPRGQTRSYTQVAEEIGRPTAARAVARACATNPVALVVPCHRVVRGDGSLSGYRWGLEVKAGLLEAERRPAPTPDTMVG